MAERLSAARVVLAIALSATPLASGVELRDPTRPPSALQSASGEGVSAPTRVATLTSIRIDAGQRVAVIGGTRVKVGDAIGEGTVRAIRSTEVIVGTPAGPRVLKLYPSVHRQARDARNRPDTGIARGRTAPTAVAGGDAPGARRAPIQGGSPQ